MTASARGALIGIEGIDAVGKKTQTSLLNARLRARGHSVRIFSFPDYGTVIGAEIRRFLQGGSSYPPEVRHILFAANRWEKKVELETLLSGSDIVIVNRYTESNLAYGIANGLSLDWLLNLEVGLPRPDGVIVLDAPPASLLSRRGRDKDEYERNTHLQEKTREAYLKLATQFHWNVVPATGGIEAINTEVIRVASDLLKGCGRTF